MDEITSVKINELPSGDVAAENLFIFGVGDKMYTDLISSLVALVPTSTVGVKASLSDYNVTVLEADLTSFLNTINLTITAGDVKFIRFFLLDSQMYLSRMTYAVPLSNGTYNPLGSSLAFSDLIMINKEYMMPNADANTVTYSFDSIAEINTSDPAIDLSDSLLTYILIIADVAYLFIGVNGVYGDGELQIEETDLSIINTGPQFNLKVLQTGETPIENVNEIEFDGATVVNDGGGKVTVTVTGGWGTPTLAETLVIGNREVDVFPSNYTIEPIDRSKHWITDKDNISSDIEIEITNDSFFDLNYYSSYIFTNTTDFDVTFVNNSDFINIGTSNFTIAKGQTAYVHFFQPFGNFWINYLTDGLGGGGTVPDATPTVKGIAKLYTSLGSNTDGAVDQNTVNSALNLKSDKPRWMQLDSDYTLTSQTALQKIFNVGSSGNGSFEVEAGKRYKFVLRFNGVAFSSTSGFVSFGALGTATFSQIQYTAISTKSAGTGPATAQIRTVDTFADTSITTANNSIQCNSIIHGEFKCDGSGTFIASIGMSIASSAVIENGAFIYIEEIGSNSVTSNGAI